MRRNLRVRWALRLAAVVLGVVFFAGMLFDRLPVALSFLGYVLVAVAVPWLWPRQLGSWRGLVALAVMAAVPVLLLRVGRLPVESSSMLYAAALLWLLAVWAALPSTMLLLMWRRRASVTLLLLGFALLPVATLLTLASGTYALDATPVVQTTTMTPAVMVQQFSTIMPLWFVMLGCGLGPFFF